MRRIVITGSESTGKTELTRQLSDKYNCKFIPEYSREYIENLSRPYTKQDVLNIGRKQIDQYKEVIRSGECAIFDTWLIITNVWLKVVFNSEEALISRTISDSKIDLYLLCSNDLPWVPDPVRENGGKMRDKLFEMYREELLKNNLPFRVIEGKGEERLRNAIFTIEEYFKNKEK